MADFCLDLLQCPVRKDTATGLQVTEPENGHIRVYNKLYFLHKVCQYKYTLFLTLFDLNIWKLTVVLSSVLPSYLIHYTWSSLFFFLACGPLPVLAVHLQPNNRANEHATVHVFIYVSFSIASLSLPLGVISQVQLLNILLGEWKE